MRTLHVTGSSLKKLEKKKRIDSKFVINAQTKEVINPYQVKEMFSERNIGDQVLSQDDRDDRC